MKEKNILLILALVIGPTLFGLTCYFLIYKTDIPNNNQVEIVEDSFKCQELELKNEYLFELVNENNPDESYVIPDFFREYLYWSLDTRIESYFENPIQAKLYVFESKKGSKEIWGLTTSDLDSNETIGIQNYHKSHWSYFVILLIPLFWSLLLLIGLRSKVGTKEIISGFIGLLPVAIWWVINY